MLDVYFSPDKFIHVSIMVKKRIVPWIFWLINPKHQTDFYLYVMNYSKLDVYLENWNLKGILGTYGWHTYKNIIVRVHRYTL